MAHIGPESLLMGMALLAGLVYGAAAALRSRKPDVHTTMAPR